MKSRGQRRYGFLLLENRLCVAMSRQHRLLVVVGDSAMAKGREAKASVARVVRVSGALRGAGWQRRSELKRPVLSYGPQAHADPGGRNDRVWVLWPGLGFSGSCAGTPTCRHQPAAEGRARRAAGEPAHRSRAGRTSRCASRARGVRRHRA